MDLEKFLVFWLYILAILGAALGVFLITRSGKNQDDSGGTDTKASSDKTTKKNPLGLHDFSLSTGRYVRISPLPASNEHSAYAWFKTNVKCHVTLIRTIDDTGRLLYKVDLDKKGVLSLQVYDANGQTTKSLLSDPGVFLPYRYNHVGVTIGAEKVVLYLNGRPLLNAPGHHLYAQHKMEILLSYGSNCEVLVSHFVSSQQAEEERIAKALYNSSNPQLILSKPSAWVPFARKRPLDVLSLTNVNVN